MTNCTNCPVQQGYKPAEAAHQIEEPDQRVSDAAIDAVFDGMPDGTQGFLKSWGYRQFARGVLALAAPAAQAVEPDVNSAVEALVTAAFIEGGVSAANTEAARQLTEQRKHELLSAIAALRATPPAPAQVVMPDGLELIQELVKAEAEKTSLHRAFMGKSMPALEYDRFQRLRDERVPALWKQVRTLLAATPQAQDVQDAGLLDWLSKQYRGPDFRWGDPVTEVVVIEMPRGCSYCGDFKLDMRAAIAASAKGGA